MPDGGWDAALSRIHDQVNTDERLARVQLKAAEAEQADRHTAEVVLQRVESDRVALAAVARYLDPYSSCDRRAAETIVANILAARFMARPTTSRCRTSPRWMMSDADTIRAATAATLRTVAEWGPTITREEFLALADAVEVMGDDDGWSCPVCEEVECDTGCPLEPIRSRSVVR